MIRKTRGSVRGPAMLLWFAIFFINYCCCCSAQEVSFSFSTFHPDVESIAYLGDASPSRGAIQLTLNSATESLQHSTGRAIFNHQVHVWDGATNARASFNTSFTFSIRGFNSTAFGDGLAFVFVPNASFLPAHSYGGWLGLCNEQSNRKSSNHFLAVEFDTFMNSWDPDDNHVAIDVNSVESTAYTSLGSSSLNLKSDQNITAWIDYDGERKKLDVYLAESSKSKPAGGPVLSEVIDFSEFLLEYMYVGFSAATGLHPETHTLYSWNFSSFGLRNTRRERKVAAIGASVLAGIVLLSLIGAVARKWYKMRYQYDDGNWEPPDLPTQELDFGPRRFTYRELKKATKKFTEDRLLGQGGFGSVYRGVLPDSKKVVAIKRIPKRSKQGIQVFISELRIIGRLRHRNLVPLEGWCHDRGELMLVYEYMPNGSLDKMIFRNDGQGLKWNQRYKVITGLAAALLYLHEEWEQQVIHRDVKASNVMLDADFNARLGDFGLARLISHSKDAETTIVAGTPGYLAPEYISTGKATKESDVYSFGIVVLEVTSGRRPMGGDLPDEVALIEWVWKLHGQGKLLDATDPNLAGECTSEEMIRLLLIGLACCHPDPSARLTMRQVMDILRKDYPPPHVPLSKPKAHYGPALPMSISELTSHETQPSPILPKTGGLSSLDKASSPLTEPLLSKR